MIFGDGDGRIMELILKKALEILQSKCTLPKEQKKQN